MRSASFFMWWKSGDVCEQQIIRHAVEDDCDLVRAGGGDGGGRRLARSKRCARDRPACIDISAADCDVGRRRAVADGECADGAGAGGGGAGQIDVLRARRY